MGVRQELCDNHGHDFLFADGYDSAIIGVCVGHDSGRIVYDVEKMIEACVQDMGMSEEESWEWLEYNTFGAYVGEDTPIYVEGYSSTDL
tara:strand:- start:1894 stop:2160 length:267 start_codon:yes stop_codon:yes gene_type:complete